jgi:hypothetical protein
MCFSLMIAKRTRKNKAKVGGSQEFFHCGLSFARWEEKHGGNGRKQLH